MSPKTLKPIFVLPGKGVFLQAWNLFVFSSIFAVLFNTFYADGIEVKVKPEEMTHLMDRPKTESTPFTGYPGWKNNKGKSAPAKPTAEKSPWGNITRLSLMGTKNRFDKKNCQFLDARNAEEYKEGHIPGALNFSAMEMDKFAPQVMPMLAEKTREIVVYCAGGDCTLSLELAQNLIEQGYTHVEVFEGGWPEWKKAAYPFRTGEAP